MRSFVRDFLEGSKELLILVRLCPSDLRSVTVLTLLLNLGELRKIANMVASHQCVLRNMTLCSVELG